MSGPSGLKAKKSPALAVKKAPAAAAAWKPIAMPAASTRMERVRLKLEDDILNRRLVPGGKLDEEEIAARLGVSRTPVREALKALAASGLVALRPHQGAFVAAPSPRAIVEMVETMAVLEIACAVMAARRHAAVDRDALLKAQDRCESPAALRDPHTFYAANIAFHEAIDRASHNLFLADQAQALRQRLDPFRRQIATHPGLIQAANREHRAIVAAIFGMNEDAARDAMRHHLDALRDRIAVLVDSFTIEPHERRRTG